MKRPTLIALVLSLNGCAHSVTPRPTDGVSTAPPAVADQAPATQCASTTPAMSPAERIAKGGSALDAYHRQDGVWLPHAPVLVNEDFDFALAMSMEGGVGAGLAAAKRKENNQKRAEALSELRFDEALNARLAELRCCGKDVYFLVWGAEGKIKMVVDGEGAAKVVEGEGALGAAEIVRRAGEMLREEAVTKR